MKKLLNYSLLLVIALVMFIGKVNASNYIEITNVSLKDKSETATEVDKATFTSKNIDTNVFFYKTGDYINYEVAIKNISKEPIIIKNITTPYAGNSGNISYQYSWEDENTTIRPNQEKTMNLKVYYSNPISDSKFDAAGMYNDLDEVTITFLQGNIESAQTGDNTPDFILIGLIAFFLLANIIYYYITKKKNAKFKKSFLLTSIILIIISIILKSSFAFVSETINISTRFKIKMLPTMASSCSISTPASKAFNISNIYEYTPDDYNGYCINITNITGQDAAEYVQSVTNGLTDFTDVFEDTGTLNTEKLTKVKITNSTSMPNTYNISDLDYNLTLTSDVSEKQDGTVIMGVYRNIAGGYLILIGGEGGVRTSTNTSYLFSGYDYKFNINTGSATRSRNIYYLTDYHDLNNLDTSYSTNMTGMFANNAIAGKTFINSAMNTTNVKYMTGMFAYFGIASHTVDLDINNFDTSKVIDMSEMFYYSGYASDNVSLKIGNIDTSNVESMDYMFANFGKKTVEIKNFDISKWNTEKVETMKYMFSGYGAGLTSLQFDLSKWNTSTLTNISNMFEDFGQSAGIFSLNLSGWDTSRITDMHNLFNEAGTIATSFNLDLSKWDTKSVSDMKKMFYKTGASAINSTYYLNNMTFNDIQSENGISSSTDSIFYGISKSAKIYVKDNVAKEFVKAKAQVDENNIIIKS